MCSALPCLPLVQGYFLRGTGRWPAVERWFEALEKRPTYLGQKSDFYTHSHDLPPQLGGEARLRMWGQRTGGRSDVYAHSHDLPPQLGGGSGLADVGRG